MDKVLFRIEEVASKTGLTKRTLRFYEDLDLVSPVRTDAGYRLYSEEDIEKLKRIIEIKEILGFSLTEIKDVMELEKNLQNILNGKSRDTSFIEASIDKINDQIQLIEDKEAKMERVKVKYQDILAKLKDLVS